MAITLNRSLYHKAVSEGKSFSAVLEEQFDAADEVREEGLDAFETLLKREGIVTKSLYEKGIGASNVDAFYRTDESKLLFPEYVSRNLRSAFASYAPLNLLIGQRTLVDSPKVDTYYLDKPDASKTRAKRVTEAANLPKSTIKTRKQSVEFYKYGQAIEASYEVLRRMKVDMLARHIKFIGIQAAEDKVGEIINVLINGDGNSNAAQSFDLTDLDTAATAGTLTATGWLKFLMKFKTFPADTLIASEEAFVKILLTQMPNLSTSEVLAMLKDGNTTGVRLNTPQMPRLNQTLMWHEDVTGTKVIGLNRDAGIEELTEAGSDIMEADKFILNQTQVLTISENSGYSKMFKESAYILDIGA